MRCFCRPPEDGGWHPRFLRVFLAPLGGLGKAPLVLMLPLGGFSLPSPTDCRLVIDEDDVHRCGRCQAEFTALEDFVQHKLQKVCQRVPQEALPASPSTAALLDQEVSLLSNCHLSLTHTFPSSLSSPDSRRRWWWHAGTDLYSWFPVTLGQIVGEGGSGPCHQEPGVLWGFLHGLAFFSVASGQSLCSWEPGFLFSRSPRVCPEGLSMVAFVLLACLLSYTHSSWGSHNKI